MKILAAMSGGVDSSVAAAMLVEEGHEVTGVHLRLADVHGEAADGRVHGCCGVTDADDARRVAQVLDIPFYVWNMKEAFGEHVVRDFVDAYASGRTPNPCVRCNEKIKFGALLDRAVATGFDALATGHYAVARDGRLFRAADPDKDQSYVLARITGEQIARARFPVGLQRKSETRARAAELSLRVANKPESYDICFVPGGDAGEFVQEQLGGARPGEIVDPSGRVLGEHDGIHRFTVGQRRGLGLALAERAYVLDVDAPANRIVIGPGELLARRGLEASEVSWIAGAPGDVDAVQVRAHGEPIPARLEDATEDRATVRFERPERGIAPGQLVAFYAGAEVLGGATIERAL
ncbi:MAG TPA: tRNA 2-thiouridine(34) synthase MnmA [Actinomycetota bacterium]